MLKFLTENKDAFTSVGAIIGLAIFAFGAYQYWRAERWKRTEFLAKLYSEFLSDPWANRAMWMLDGDTRRIYFEEGDKHKLYKVDWKAVCNGLREYDSTREFTSLDLHIRDSFDAFFTYIVQFELAIKNGLVKKADVRPYLAYWSELLNVEAKEVESEKLRNCVIKYIDDVGFSAVEEFLKRKLEREL
jgi:hypothetical protein